ncbi:reverse transcriptase domain-containing protein, partial [Tanacetum coccineum]
MKEVQSLNGKLAGWTTEAEEAFTQLKQHIAALPTLVAPRPGEELIMYLSTTHGAISVVLLIDRDSVQTPVYFVSKALKETEINYSAMEKLILALVFAAKRLYRYFQAHPIVSEVKLQEPWILFTDGSSCVDGSGAGLILTNEAEYEALITGLRIAARMGIRNLEANVDSRLVANHVLGAKEDNMIQYLDKTKSLIQGFDRFTIRQVPRGNNKKAVIEEQDPTWMTPIVEFINTGTLP